MTTTEFLKRLCEGYVRAYRTLNQHRTSTWTDVTRGELAHFSRLGEMLGFRARLDYHQMDLSWHDADTTKLVLYLERETERSLVLAETLRKLFDTVEPRAAAYLVAVLGWVTESDLPGINVRITQSLGDRSLLVIAWIGSGKDDPNIRMEAVVYSGAQIHRRSAQPVLDTDGYWYVYFSSPWTPANQSSAG